MGAGGRGPDAEPRRLIVPLLETRGLSKHFGGLAAVNRTILLDGFVAATWKRKRNSAGMMVDVSPLRTLKAGERRSIEGEFASYADYQGTSISVEFK